MMIVIGMLTPHCWTMLWYSHSSGSVNKTRPIAMYFIGMSLSVCATTVVTPERVASKPLLIPENSDLRSEISVQMPPINIAPTPR